MVKTLVSQSDKDYLATLRPKKAPLFWMQTARCSGGILGDRGCGLPTRWVYMSNHRVLPKFAICPVCGRRALFAFWQMRLDRRFVPTPAQVKDVRALYGDWHRMAKGAQPVYGKEMWECILIHCPPWVPERLVGGLIALSHTR